jgi:photosystem II stability/assembly factor-like uncharacterized protein
MSKRSLAVLTLSLLLLSSLAIAQNARPLHQPTLTSQNSGTANSLIAVSPVNSRVVWAAGRNGTYTVTTNGGATWHAGVVPGAEALQFRDVQAFSDKVAYLLSIGNGTDSRIYKTTDGGAHWTLQFQNQNPDAFYDCFAFWTPKRGIAVSDAVAGRFPDLRTTDGTTWHDIGDNLPPALAGEAQFASSGTCITTQGGQRAWIVTGGASPSRVIATADGGDTWTVQPSPLRGSPSAGIFSVDFRNPWHGFIGGGDLDPAAPPFPQTARSSDGGRTWELTTTQPNIGTIFGLSYVQGTGNGSNDGDHDAGEQGHAIVVTGPGGAAWTPDEGDRWFTLPGVANFWAVAFATPKAGWLVGTDGRIIKISF